jgi:protein-arginine kinase activator protein McsA
VGADQDLLFGKLAAGRKYCTTAQIDKCISIQANNRDRVPLGQILLREGYITQEQHSEILAVQRRNLSAIDPVSKVRKESILIGKLAVHGKLMTEADVNACLRLQARDGEKRSIGEIMVEQGYLSPAQLKGLLSKQHKRIMSCPKCRLSFTVLSSTQAKVVSCPRCKGRLQEGKPNDSVRTDAHLETSTSNRIRRETAKAAPATENAGSIRMVNMTCPMCSKPFSEPVDSKGRVDCPHCFSTFSA